MLALDRSSVFSEETDRCLIMPQGPEGLEPQKLTVIEVPIIQSHMVSYQHASSSSAGGW